MRMRFRTDNWLYAQWKAEGHTPEQLALDREDADKLKEFVATPKAQPGDVWRLMWARLNNSNPDPPKLAGYAIGCPKCKLVHCWTLSQDCNQKVTGSYVDIQTKQKIATQSCVHSGVSSCWQWTGSAEENTLSASPSLHELGACGFHGWLCNGELSEC